MANKIQQLTNADKNEVLSGTSKVLPIRPSDNGWTAEQIREKGYQGIEKLFEIVNYTITQANTIFDDVGSSIEEQKELVRLFNSNVKRKINFSNFSIGRERYENLPQQATKYIFTEIFTHSTVSILKEYEENGITKTVSSEETPSFVEYKSPTNNNNGKIKFSVYDRRYTTHYENIEFTISDLDNFLVDNFAGLEGRYNGNYNNGTECFVKKYDISRDTYFGDKAKFSLALLSPYRELGKSTIEYLLRVFYFDGEKIVVESSLVWLNIGDFVRVNEHKHEFEVDISFTKFLSIEIGSGSDVDVEEIVNQIKQLQEFATKEDLQNVIEIAEGKTKSYLLSCNDVIQEEFLPYMTYYNAKGEVLTSEQVMSIANNGTCVNNLFNSQDNQIPVYDMNNWYLIVEYNYPSMSATSKMIITNVDNPFKQGDILIVTETDVPDRYATDIGVFYKMETFDLSPFVRKTGDETISGVKTFNNGIKIFDRLFTYTDGLNAFTIQEGTRLAVGGDLLPLRSQPIYARNIGSSANKWDDLFLSHQANIGNWWIRSLYDNLYFGFSENNNKIQLSATELKCDVDITAWANQNLGTNDNPFNDVNITGEIKVKDSEAQYRKVQCLSQEDYDALSTKDENVLYLIKE